MLTLVEDSCSLLLKALIDYLALIRHVYVKLLWYSVLIN